MTRALGTSLTLLIVLSAVLSVGGCTFPEVHDPTLWVADARLISDRIECLVETAVESKQPLNPEPSGEPRKLHQSHYLLEFPVYADGVTDPRPAVFRELDDATWNAYRHSFGSLFVRTYRHKTPDGDGMMRIETGDYGGPGVRVTLVNDGRERVAMLWMRDYFLRRGDRYEQRERPSPQADGAG